MKVRMLAFVSTVPPPPPRAPKKTKISANRSCNKCIYFDNGSCRLFKYKFATTETMVNYYFDADWCRLDETLCGPDANYFKPIDK